jgi:putative sterol carrier protein
MATLQELTERVKSAVGADSGLSNSLKLDLRGEGVIHIEGGQVSNEDRVADLTITISQADLKALARGELDAMNAVISGRLGLSDMGLAMALRPQMQALFARLA